ncbi:MAG: hypothetical protein LAT61_06365 [Alcanivorax sp.]|nr:hypothetical protein [Alcanivorax sp.]
MRYTPMLSALMLSILLLSACGGSSSDNLSTAPSDEGPRTDTPDQPGENDEGGEGAPPDEEAGQASGPAFPSPEWYARELENYARVLEAPIEQVSSPAFMLRWTSQSVANAASYAARAGEDNSWLLGGVTTLLGSLVNQLTDPFSEPEALFTLVQDTLTDTIGQLQENPMAALALVGNTPVTPLCTSWAAQCAGDPFRYPGADSFYGTVGEVQPVVFYDRECARLSGRVWRPAGLPDGAVVPGVVIQNGSVQAPETLYWWAAQMLVENGYAVLTFDPRGQGRSDMQTPQGVQGSNFNPAVFWEGLVDAIDFFRSSPAQPYPHNETCQGTQPTPVTAFNPYFGDIDPERLGIAGHSLGAVGVSIVQGMGAEGAAPWDGQLDNHNPVTVAVAWDGAIAPAVEGEGSGGGSSPIGLVFGLLGDDAPRPAFAPRVPMMIQDSEYGLTPVPFAQPPEPRSQLGPFEAWQRAGVPSMSFTIQGSSHYEWSLLPSFPTSSWCPQVVDGRCQGGWGLPMAQHYSLAWLDRYLKLPGEVGFDTADQRLLADEDWQARLSFYFEADRDFVTRDGIRIIGLSR